MVWDCGLDSSGSGRKPVVGFCEHGNESLDSIKFGIVWLAEEGLCSMKIVWSFSVLSSSYRK